MLDRFKGYHHIANLGNGVFIQTFLLTTYVALLKQ
ncbi:MAG: hypothetical protein AB8B61_08320 [Cyclobacteriaceae bacterium]